MQYSCFIHIHARTYSHQDATAEGAQGVEEIAGDTTRKSH